MQHWHAPPKLCRTLFAFDGSLKRQGRDALKRYFLGFLVSFTTETDVPVVWVTAGRCSNDQSATYQMRWKRLDDLSVVAHVAIHNEEAGQEVARASLGELRRVEECTVGAFTSQIIRGGVGPSPLVLSVVGQPTAVGRQPIPRRRWPTAFAGRPVLY